MRAAVLVDEVHPLVARLAQTLVGLGAVAHLVPWSELVVRLDGDGAHLDTLDEADVVYLDRMAGTQVELLAEWSRQRGVPVVNDPRAYGLARNRSLAARRLARTGLPAPAAVVCHRMSALRAAVAGPVVVTSPRGECAEELLIGHDLADDDLERLLSFDGTALVRHLPAPARFVWRVDVVDGRVIVVARRHAANHGGQVDLLHPEDPEAAAAAALATAAARSLGLVVASIDVTAGRPAVLDVNPEPAVARNELPAAIASSLLRHAAPARR